MPGTFDLPVHYQGEDLFLKAELLPTGYTHKIKVTVENMAIFFEPDEERNYRALAEHADGDKIGQLDKKLLQAISETLYDLFGNEQ